MSFTQNFLFTSLEIVEATILIKTQEAVDYVSTQGRIHLINSNFSIDVANNFFCNFQLFSYFLFYNITLIETLISIEKRYDSLWAKAEQDNTTTASTCSKFKIFMMWAWKFDTTELWAIEVEAFILFWLKFISLLKRDEVHDRILI